MWRLVADGIILEEVVVDFEILRRRAGSDLLIVGWQHAFTPGENVSEAIPLELAATGAAVTVEDGDQLIFRYTGDSGALPMAYVPNGEGEVTGGRIPFIDLPQ